MNVNRFAKIIAENESVTEEQTKRIAYLVGHHHTYTNIEGIDYQILVEADFLVNFYEDNCKKEAIQYTYQQIFNTNTGINICSTMFEMK